MYKPIMQQMALDKVPSLITLQRSKRLGKQIHLIFVKNETRRLKTGKEEIFDWRHISAKCKDYQAVYPSQSSSHCSKSWMKQYEDRKIQHLKELVNLLKEMRFEIKTRNTEHFLGQ